MIFDPDLVYTYAPKSAVVDVLLNDIGCIGPDVAAPKKEGEIRVFLLGGSTSFAPPYVRTVQSVLEEAYGAGVKVVSCGRPRYTSYSNRINFERNILPLKPDAVGVYLGINDNIYNSFPWLNDQPDVGYFNWRSKTDLLSLQYLKYHAWDKTLRATPRFGKTLRSEGILKENLEQIIALSDSNRVAVALSTFALSLPTVDEALVERIADDEPKMRHFWGTVESTVRGVETHNRLIRSIAQKKGVPLAETAESISRDSEHFFDLCHMTEKGAEVLGKEMGEALKRALLIKGGSS